LCSAYARVVSSLDRAGVVYFETQQSDVGRAVLRRARMPEDLSTIVVVEAACGDVRGYVKSTAVLRTFAALGAPWNAMGAFLLVPRVVRDGVYAFVAKNRHRVFGTNGGRCALPDAVLRRRMTRSLPKELLDE
jgi:predicted DCC family thiol-disulfide oxidoreductase YuxK